MKIRSVTCFYDPSVRDADQHLLQLGRLAAAARHAFGEAGYEVQTTRLATIPFPCTVPTCCDESVVRLAVQLEREAKEQGFDYLSLGPALPEEPNSYRLIPTILARTQDVFCGGCLNDGYKADLDAIWASAAVIAEAAHISADGFGNLRFAALANVPAFAPFFPAAYHQPGHPPAFALALESADVAVECLGSDGSVDDRRRTWLAALENHASRLAEVVERLAQTYKVQFKGFDFSPAPYPDAACSLGGAIERLSGAPLGSPSSLLAAAACAEALDRGTWQRAGFNGLMLPVLEDSVLAQRVAEGSLTIRDLLMYSAVCGTGLDTVPIPGESSVAALAGVLMDMTALALRLDKPLTARLMPIPGKTAGEKVAFDFSYFAPGAVMALSEAAITGPLAGGGKVQITPRQPG